MVQRDPQPQFTWPASAAALLMIPSIGVLNTDVVGPWYEFASAVTWACVAVMFTCVGLAIVNASRQACGESSERG